MSLIPTSKFGKCSQCGTDNTACVKVAKDLFCLQCHKTNKTKVQVDKANKKAKLQRTLSSLKSIPENKEAIRSKSELDKWFLDRRNEMTGYCVCGAKSCKDNERYFRYSLAHVLPKKTFKSIATNANNCIELCFFENSCHTNFDNLGYANCKENNPKLWAIIVRKFKVLFPYIAENEIKFIPDVLMETLQEEDIAV